MTDTTSKDAYLILDDGLMFKGKALGKPGTTGGEICFNTGMTGYQEIYTDPSYYGQIIVNTSTHIGNYGTRNDEEESNGVKFSGLVCDTFARNFSRINAEQSLNEYLFENGITGISDVDTRMIVRHIRSKGAMNALISTELSNPDALKEALAKVPPMLNLELASAVTTRHAYFYGDPNAAYKVAVIDLGIKKSILKNLANNGLYCQVFPAKTSYKDIEQWQPDAYFISNGPGDPASTHYATQTVRQIIDSGKPTFGICLGHQIIALASGLKTFKMHHGHRGLNHPVINKLTGKSEITSQNHGFAVEMPHNGSHPGVEITHTNLNDNTVEGLKLVNKHVFSVQYHPEACPGPHDSYYLFEQFSKLISSTKVA